MLPYCAEQFRRFDYPGYISALLASASVREAWFAIGAYHAEIAHVLDHMGEEMIGFVRFAWWRELVEGLFSGKMLTGHPVSESLAPLVNAGKLEKAPLLAIIDAYEADAATRNEPSEGREAFAQSYEAMFQLFAQVAGEVFTAQLKELAVVWGKLHRGEQVQYHPALKSIPRTFRAHAKAACYLAKRNGKPVGQAGLILAILF